MQCVCVCIKHRKNIYKQQKYIEILTITIHLNNYHHFIIAHSQYFHITDLPVSRSPPVWKCFIYLNAAEMSKCLLKKSKTKIWRHIWSPTKLNKVFTCLQQSPSATNCLIWLKRPIICLCFTNMIGLFRQNMHKRRSIHSPLTAEDTYRWWQSSHTGPSCCYVSPSSKTDCPEEAGSILYQLLL